MPDRPIAPSDVPGTTPPNNTRKGLAAVVGFARRMSANRYVRVGFIVVAVALGGYAVARQWGAVRAGLGELGWLTVAAAMIAVLAGLVATMQIWRVLLAALGSPLPARTASRIFFLGQLGKYVPGSMWPVLVQMELAQSARVPRTRTATAAVLTLVASVCAGLLAALVSLPFLPSDGTRDFWWVFLAVPVLLAALHPKVVNTAVGLLLRVAGRPPLPTPLSARAVVAAMAWALLSWFLLGVHVWLLAVRLGASPGRGLLLAVGGFAFAWGAGFLFIIAPAGAGVRELLLIAVLTPLIGVGPATAIALVSRVLMTVGDLILAAAAGWYARRLRPA